MSHHDKDGLRTPVAQLKDLLAPVHQIDLGDVNRHGNASLDLTGVMAMALLTFGWNLQQTLGDRFDDARSAAERVFGGDPLKIDEDRIMDLQVVETIKDGRTVYASPTDKTD